MCVSDTYKKVPAEKANAIGSSELSRLAPTRQIMAIRKVAMGVVQANRATYGVARINPLKYYLHFLTFNPTFLK